MTEGSLKYSDGIAAARTLIALKASVTALQRRLPEGREQARNRFTGALGHFHWLSTKEDPAGILGKYRDAKLARITGSQTFTKETRGETRVRETFSAVAEEDQVINIVRRDPMDVNAFTEIALKVKGEAADVFDGTERVVEIVIQRRYMRQVYVH